jgi:TP901 family phage tail tape measure protein
MSINAGSVYSELVLDTSKYESAMKKAEAQMSTFASRMKTVGDKMTSIGTTLTKTVTVPILGLGTMAVKSSVDFESAFAGVRKTVDASETEFASLEKGIRNMSKEIPASAVAISEVAEAAGQLGIKTPYILSFTRTMVDLGESTNLSATEAATALARFANITQMSQKDFDRLGSVIVALGNNLATTEAEIVEMGMRLAGAGSQIGLTEAQTMSLAGALSSVGIEAEAGGSSFSKLMVDMQLAVETGNENLSNFAKVAGMSGQEFQRAFKEDAAGALITFIQGLSTSEERGISAIKVLDDMGIKEIRLRDALLRAAGASDVFSGALDLGTKAWAENTALTKEAEQRYKTTASQIEIAKNHLKDAGITIGNIVVPHLVSLAEKVKSASEWFSNLSPSMQEVIVKSAGLAAAVGPVLVAGGKVSSGIVSIIGLFGKFAPAAQAATTATTATAAATGVAAQGFSLAGLAAKAGALLLNPWTVGLAAVAVGGYAIHKTLTTETVPAVNLFADTITSVASKTGGATDYIAVKMSDTTKQVVGSYMTLDTEATKALSSLYINSTTITGNIATEMTNKYSNMNTQIKAGIDKRYQDEYNTIQKFFKDSSAITETEEANILKKMQENNTKKKSETDKYVAEINSILKKASEEKRQLKIEEQQRISELQEQMKTTAIKTLSETELESKVILERIKSHGTRITAELASEEIKNANQARDGAIKAANEKYEKTVAAIIKQRDETGEISAEQADKLIREAERQRRESIQKAEELRNGVVKKIEEMNSSISNSVDMSTGKILTAWDKLKNWWNSWTPAEKVFHAQAKVSQTYTPSKTMPSTGAIEAGKTPKKTTPMPGSQFYKKVGNNARGTDYWPGGFTWVGEEGPEIVNLPPGTKIYNHDESVKLAKSTTEKITFQQVNSPGTERVLDESAKLKDTLIAHARETHREVVSEAESQAKGHIDSVRKGTSQVKSEWQGMTDFSRKANEEITDSVRESGDKQAQHRSKIVMDALQKAQEMKSGVVRKYSELKAEAANIIEEKGRAISEKWMQLNTNAYSWSGSMVSMFKKGITDKVGSVIETARGIGEGIKDFLGFSSPTKEGPLSQSDKWMPNFMTMLADGIRQNASKVEKSSEELAQKIGDSLSKVNNYATYTVDIIEKKFKLWILQNNAVAESFEYLAQQIEMQEQKHEILNAQIEATNEALNRIIAKYGEGSVQALEYQNKLLDLKIAQAELKDEIDKTTGAIAGQVDELTKWVNSVANLGKDAGRVAEGLRSGDKDKVHESALVLKLTREWEETGNIKIGKNAKGTDNWPGGLTWIGEEGKELVDLPKGTKVYNHNKSMEIVESNEEKDTLLQRIKNTALKYGNLLSEIPRNARGTDYWRGGLTMVGEEGPEIIDLPPGTKIYNHDESVEIAKNAISSMNMNIRAPEARTNKAVSDFQSAPMPAVPVQQQKHETHLHIGTLVADEWGLKQLERKLSNFRIGENNRLGVSTT